MIQKGRKTDKQEILLFVVLLFALHVPSLDYIFPFGQLFSYISLLIGVCYAYLVIIVRKKTSPVLLLTLLLFVVYFLSTIINTPSNIKVCIKTFASPIALAFITEYYMSIRPEGFIRTARNLLAVLVITDLLSIVLVPNGLYVSELYTDNWILGYKTSRIYIAGMPLLLFAALNDYIEKGKLTLVFHGLSLLGIADAYLSKGTGGTASMALLYGLLFIYELFRKYRMMGLVNRILKTKVMLPIIATLVLMFAIFQQFDILEFIIVGILHKNMTLTNRTKIWKACLDLFKTSPIIGKGYIISEQFIELTGVRGGTQPHNQVLALLVYSGIVGLAVYLCLLYCVCRKSDQDWSNLSKITFLYIISNLILGIVSMNLFAAWHYAVYIVLYYLNGLDRQEYFNLSETENLGEI